MTDRLAELGALQYAVENLSTAGTNPNRLGLAGYIHAAYTDYQVWAANDAPKLVNPFTGKPDQRTHNGSTWKVTQADGSGNNVWSPTTYGWTKV